MKFAKWTICIAVLAVLLGGCKGKEQPAETQATPPAKSDIPAVSSTPAATPSAKAPSPKPAEAPTSAAVKPALDRALLAPAKLKQQAPEKYQVNFVTTRGEFTVAVTRAWAPLGADRFYNLVKHGFYDNSAFFRVVPGFVVQFGISGTPAVSAAWKHTEFKDDPLGHGNKRGTITFATAGPNTRTTQVFINLKDNDRLDGMGFSPFGVVEGSGMNVVEMMYEGYGDDAGPAQDQIEAQGLPYEKQGWPKLDYIVSASIAGEGAAAAPNKVQ
jgi:peptidyl-prolyl cis-trans isomerase A (cyclophilin A)